MVTLVDEEDEHPDEPPGRIDSSWGGGGGVADELYLQPLSLL